MRAGLLATVSLLLISACSERQIYDSIQNGRESHCNNLPAGPERDTCLEDAQGPEYDEYQRELKKLE